MLTSVQKYLFAVIALIVWLTPSQAKSQNTIESNISTLKSLGKISPVSSSDISQSPWGIQFNLLPPHLNRAAEEIDFVELQPTLNVLLQQASQLGIKWARVSVNWNTIEDRNGEFHWQYLDSTLNGLRDRGIESYVCLHGGHPAFTDNLPPVISDSALQVWTDYITELVTRYRDLVDYWEIWNEPNYPSFWKPEPNAYDYVRMVKHIVPVIRKLDEDAQIIAGSLARVDVPYARDMFAFGIAPFIDVVTVHPYNAIPEGSVRKIGYPVRTPDYYLPSSHQFSELKKLIHSQKNSIELWQAECGYPSEQHSHGWQGTGPWGENIQAKWLLRRMLVDVSQNLKVSAYFALQEFTLGNGDRKNAKGLLRLHSLQPKPAFYAFQNLAAVVHGELDPLESNLDVEILTTGDFLGAHSEDLLTVALQNSDGMKMVAFWLPWRAQENVKPGTCLMTLQQPQFENPVLINLLDGTVYKMEFAEGSKNRYKLPFADVPFLIAEQVAATFE